MVQKYFNDFERFCDLSSPNSSVQGTLGEQCKHSVKHCGFLIPGRSRAEYIRASQDDNVRENKLALHGFTFLSFVIRTGSLDYSRGRDTLIHRHHGTYVSDVSVYFWLREFKADYLL